MITNRKVLLLNASYEPLGIVTVPRAIRLVWRGTAETVELDGDRVLRSVRASYRCPSVVRLVTYVNVRRRRTAETIELDGDRVLRSVRASYPCPSVVRLVTYINVRRRRTAGNLRTRILMRDRYRCQYCGERGTAVDMTMDHILPRSRGGRTCPENLAASCKRCNSRKGDRTPVEARMPLLTDPSALMYDHDHAAIRHAAASRPEWQKYVEPAVVAAAVS